MRLNRLLTTLSLVPGLCAALALTTPQTADACGGFFCDGGPGGMQVDQTGENVMFVIDGARVEAHIQIQYDPNTNAQNFAWVIPLQAVPTFSVGSDPMFTALLNSTVPTYGLNNQQEFCGGGGGDDGLDNGDTGGGDPTGTGQGTSDGETGEPPVEVIAKDIVGAYEATVLEANDPMELMTWLDENGYQQDPEAVDIFAEYIAEGFLFAAFKLQHAAELDEVHPVVLEFSTGEACVPLKLTRIAAQDNMAVRTFFLGNNRTVPTNFKHVLVNPLMIDWLDLSDLTDQYNNLISKAVDSLAAAGHAFVTEYAGTSTVVNPQAFGVFSEAWDASPFPQLEVTQVLDELEGQGLAQCFQGDFCNYFHPLMKGLLNTYLPVPDGVEESDFYACLSCYEEMIDLNAWDGQAFADDMNTRIIEPGAHAVGLLETWPYLTRMYTTISPNEMTLDPIFDQNPDLDDVAAIRTATRTFLCSGDTLVTLPDGREIYIPAGEPWPEWAGELPGVTEAGLPDAEEVQQASLSGAPMVLVDNTAIIDSAIEAWNLAHGWPPEEPDLETDGNGNSDSSTGAETEGTGGGGGCGCTTDAGAGGTGVVFSLLLAAGLLGRRRRR